MNDKGYINKQYSVFDRIFFGLSGLIFFMAFKSQLYTILAEGNAYLLFVTPFVGCASYLFCYTAFKGKAPYWFKDKSMFGSTNKKTHESE